LYGKGSQSSIYFDGVLIGTWNGLDASGNPATNGNYFVKINSTDPLGVTTTVTQRVTVNRSISEATIQVFNEAGEVVRNLYAYVANSGANTATQVQLSTNVFELNSTDTSGTIPNQVSIYLNNGTTVVWNGLTDSGAVVTTGQYYIEIHTQDGQGGETVITKKVTVLSENSHHELGSIVAEPNVVNPSSGYSITFWSNSVPSLTLMYRIYDVAGELIQYPTYGPSGFGTARWNASGLASGLYFAVVDALNFQGGLVGRQNLKIVVVH